MGIGDPQGVVVYRFTWELARVLHHKWQPHGAAKRG